MKKKMRQILSLVLTVCMVASLTPAVFADSVTTVSDMNALITALEAGGTIRLGSDITVTEPLTVSVDTTLDLNGHTLSVDHNSMANYAVLVSDNLIIDDSGSDGKITSHTSNTLFLDYDNGDQNNSLTLLDGTVENTCSEMGDSAIVAIGRTYSSVTISGGTVWSSHGDAIIAQSPVTITDGAFHGDLFFFTGSGVSITGGHYDRDPGKAYDFYGKAYEVTPDAAVSGYSYKVQAIPAGDLVNVSYEFPVSGLIKTDDHFRKNTVISMPEAPDYAGHRFIAWTVESTAVIFPYQLGESNKTFTAVYAEDPVAPEDFFPEEHDLTYLYVGETPMMTNGTPAGDLPYTIGNGETGTATLSYNTTDEVYTLTLDNYSFSGEGYQWNYSGNNFTSGIYAKGNLAILVKDASSITAAADNAGVDGSAGIVVTGGNLLIKGIEGTSDPTLAIDSAGRDDGSLSAGVFVDGSLQVESCILDTSAQNGNSTYGIAVQGSTSQTTGDIHIIEANVTATAEDSEYGLGIVAIGDLTIENDSTVIVKGTGHVYSCGAKCNDLEITGDSSLSCTANGYDAASEQCYGVCAGNDITVEEALLYGTAGSATTDWSHGVYADGDLTVASHGIVLGISEGSTDNGDSTGVEAGEITVEAYGTLYGLGGDVTENGDSTGVRSYSVTVEDNAALRGVGGDVESGSSHGVYVLDTMTVSGNGVEDDDGSYGAVFARGGDAAGVDGDSYGLYILDDMNVSDDGAVYAYGGTATGGSSCGIASCGALVISENSQVKATGGNARSSFGVYLRPDSFVGSGTTLYIKEGSWLEATGGTAAKESFGVYISRGILQMETDDNGDLRLDATGGTAPESYGVSVRGISDNSSRQAILLKDSAKVFALGGNAPSSASGSISRGVYACGSITLQDCSLLDASTEPDVETGIGIAFDGPYDLTLSGRAMVMAVAGKTQKGNAGIASQGGKLTVPEGCFLYALADGATSVSVGLSLFSAIETGGVIAAYANKGGQSYGILMLNDNGGNKQIELQHGQLGASAQTAAICSVDENMETFSDVTVTARYIEYSSTYETENTVKVATDPATLDANSEYKHILAHTDGTIENLSLLDITTSISCGSTVQFTARALPQAIVNVEEERWVRTSDGAIISSKDPAAPGAGTYRYELILSPVDGFTFKDDGDGVAVMYKDNVYWFRPVEGRLVLTTTADQVFIPDVTVKETSDSHRSSGGGPMTTTVTVPVSGNDSTANVKVEVRGDTATIKEADIDSILNAGEVGTVTIDVSGLEKNVDEAVIPGAMFEKIADAVADGQNSADSLEIRLPAGSVTLDAAALKTISGAADGKDVMLHLDSVKVTELTDAQQEALNELTVEVVLDACLTVDGVTVSDLYGGSATVRVPYTLKDGQTAQGIVVWYVAADGKKTRVNARYDKGNIVFTIPHFSNYVIAYDAEKGAVCPKDGTCPMAAFKDLDPAAWYHDGIHFCLEKGIMNGTGNGIFDTVGSTSRAMIVTILYRIEGEPAVTAANSFADVPDGQWYTGAVLWAAENKIVEGFEDGTFRPAGDITREQMATILYRYARTRGQGFTGTWSSRLDHPDAAEISSWADEAMHWCVMNGIINGRDGKLVPGGIASRAEAATLIQRLVNQIDV